MVLSLVAPLRCVVCSRGVDALPFCARCQHDVARLRTDRSAKIAPPAGVDRVVAAYRYTGPIARAVVAGKVLGATGVWRPLGQELGRVVAAREVRADLVVAVPTDRRRRRSRGVDHAAVLARQVARAIGAPFLFPLEVRTGLPDRGAHREHDSGLPDGAVRCRCPVTARSVLLVDDVMTTGATAAASARALLDAGSGGVLLAVLAYAAGRPTRSLDRCDEFLSPDSRGIATVDTPVDREPRTARDLPVDEGHKEA
jgi:predicted amidophosphoribosyltransferase